MSLKINDKAPNFTLASTDGTDFTLNIDAAGKPCIIYFYPKDFTGVCTAEACEFRDTFSHFRNLNIDIYGISRDDIPTHQLFKKAHNLPFDLLADTDGKVAAAYGATVPIIKFTRRITFLLDPRHRIAAIYENLFSAGKHIEEMVQKVKTHNADWKQW